MNEDYFHYGDVLAGLHSKRQQLVSGQKGIERGVIRTAPIGVRISNCGDAAQSRDS